MGVMPWQEGLTPVQLFDRARTACSMVRGSGKHLVIYNEEMQKKERLNERLVSDLGRALREHEFKVYYQPKYDIRSDPPRLSSAEALIRWQHPKLGMVSPGDFIPLFEDNGQIREIDRYVWKETARQGVETEKQLVMLKQAGCALVQGFYFSRPLPAEEFEKLIMNEINHRRTEAG